MKSLHVHIDLSPLQKMSHSFDRAHPIVGLRMYARCTLYVYARCTCVAGPTQERAQGGTEKANVVLVCRATVQAALHVGKNMNYSGGVTACMNPHMHPKDLKGFKQFDTEYNKSIGRGRPTACDANRAWNEEYKEVTKLEVRAWESTVTKNVPSCHV